MPKEEKPKVKHFFSCSCGQVSEDLGKDYIKLRKSQKWCCKDCKEGKEIVQEFKGGFIVNEPEF